MEITNWLLSNFTPLHKGLKRLIIALTLIPFLMRITQTNGKGVNLELGIWLVLSYWAIILILCWIYQGFKINK